MKKRVRIETKDPKNTKDQKEPATRNGKDNAEEPATVNDDEAQNQGFGEWLRSTDGVELMRLFVIANSLVIFVTMAWPNMQQALVILKEMIMGEEDE